MPEHPFYAPTKGWTEAIHLCAGDKLVNHNGEMVVVEQVQHEILCLLYTSEKTFKAVQKDLGGARNVRRLKGMDAPVRKDEFKVAMKCGATDYHFIRLTENGWYNKSGTAPGVYIDQSFVTADIWYPMWGNGNQIYIENVPYYNYETVYFAVRIGWDEK